MSADDLLQTGAAATQRLDKWLWFARVVKTRTLAAGLVAGGKVRVNRQRIDKPGYAVRIGDVITVTAASRIRVMKVMATGVRRGPPREAAMLYEEFAPAISIGTGPAQPAFNPALEVVESRRRPTKRDRRVRRRMTGKA